MTYYQCPSCQQPTIPFWSKQSLGPGRTIACPGCGAGLSVPSSSIWVITPLLLAILVASFTDHWELHASAWLGLVSGWLLLAIGFAVTMVLHAKFSPLIKK
jgi:hypothetical protein